MMYRLHARLEKLEAVRQAHLEALSDDELEAMMGPRSFEYLDSWPLEDLERLAAKDVAMVQHFWQDYPRWLEAHES